MERPRSIDMDLVRAQQARRALDYLVGFHLSALLWRKVRGGRSAGRVQSVALRLVCEREAEIEAFEPQEYWTVDADVMGGRGRQLHGPAERARRGGAGEAEPRHRRQRRNRPRRASAAGVFRVASLVRDEVRREPVPPFTTATLQQEASRRLGFGLRKTMLIAQGLYDGVELDGGTAGLVTYVRTDSAALSKTAGASARRVVRERFGAGLPAPQDPRLPVPRPQRPGGPRGDPADGPRPHAGDGGGPSRRGRGGAVRPDLETHRRQPDGGGQAGQGEGRTGDGRREKSC